MNLVAVAIMVLIVTGFLAALLYGLTSGLAWLVAVLAILSVGLFVRWG